MLLMPVSCHLDRCPCKIYHNTKAINFMMKMFDISFQLLP